MMWEKGLFYLFSLLLWTVQPCASTGIDSDLPLPTLFECHVHGILVIGKAWRELVLNRKFWDDLMETIQDAGLDALEESIDAALEDGEVTADECEHVKAWASLILDMIKILEDQVFGMEDLLSDGISWIDDCEGILSDSLINLARKKFAEAAAVANRLLIQDAENFRQRLIEQLKKRIAEINHVEPTDKRFIGLLIQSESEHDLMGPIAVIAEVRSSEIVGITDR